MDNLTPEVICDIYNEMGITDKLIHSKHSKILPLDARHCVRGRAYTVTYSSRGESMFKNNREFLDEVPEGSIVVIDVLEDEDSSVWGSMLSLYALKHNIIGTITNGSTRDVSEMILNGIEYPVFCRGQSCQRSGTNYKVTGIGKPVFLARDKRSVRIDHGDYVVANSSGIAVISPDMLEMVMVKGIEKTRLEGKIASLINDGCKMCEIKAKL